MIDHLPNFLTSFLSLFSFFSWSASMHGTSLALAWSTWTWSPRMQTFILGRGTWRSLYVKRVPMNIQTQTKRKQTFYLEITTWSTLNSWVGGETAICRHSSTFTIRYVFKRGHGLTLFSKLKVSMSGYAEGNSQIGWHSLCQIDMEWIMGKASLQKKIN